jgi:hypothetical protein
MNLLPTDQTYREDCIRAEARAENAEEELQFLRAEIATAHRVLDSYVDRCAEYGRHGLRIAALCERIDALVKKVGENEANGWEKYSQQIRANEALVSDIEALRKSLDLVEAENLKLGQRIAGPAKKEAA